MTISNELDILANKIGRGEPVDEAEHRRILNDTAQAIRLLQLDNEALHLRREQLDATWAALEALYAWYDAKDGKKRALKDVVKILEAHRAPTGFAP